MASVEQWWDKPCSDDDLCRISPSVADWKAVAPSLGLKSTDEEVIIGYAPNSVGAQRTKMLRTWKERFGTGATYRKLADAFKMCKRQDLVDELCKLPREKTPPADIPPIPFPDQLINELAVLRIAFANFLCEYESELQKNDELQRKFVKMLQILLQVDESLKLSECFKRLIEKEVTLFNITYMEKLCEVFPQNVRATFIELVDTYKQQLHCFMAGTTVNEFKALFPASVTSSSPSVKKVSIKLKLKNFWGDKTLDDLLKLVMKLLGIAGDYLHLFKVEDGCVAVIWLCLTSHINELITKMCEVADSLQIEGVQQVYVGDKLLLGPEEAMDQHQWDTTKLKEAGMHQCHVQHQKINEVARSLSLNDETARTPTLFPIHEVFFDDKSALLVGSFASSLLAIVIYVLVRSLFLNTSTGISFGDEIDTINPMKLVLHIIHQLAHWAMTYYAQTCLKCSNSLQPFHYWMTGVNLVFVLLYVVHCYLIPDNLFYQDTTDLNIGTWSLCLWILMTKINRRGLVFGYSIPCTQGVSEFAEKWLPYYFSFIILLNFWYKPFIERLFFPRTLFDLIFITHSCLIQTHIHENKYWTLFLELMVISYFLVKVNAFYYSLTSFFCFYISFIVLMVMMIIGESPFITKIINFLIMMIALCVGYAYFWNSSIFALFVVLCYVCIMFLFNFESST